MSKIEQIIDDIEEFIESCRNQPLSPNKVIVPKDELYELLTELRLKTPDEINRYKKIISNKDAILAEAQASAESMIAKAQEHTSNLISEHEIMQQAYQQANEIVRQAAEEAAGILDSAKSDANAIRLGALSYTEEMLASVENAINHSLESSKAKYEILMNSLKDNLNIISNNKQEIHEQIHGAPPVEELVQQEDAPKSESDEFNFEFDENTFTKDYH